MGRMFGVKVGMASREPLEGLERKYGFWWWTWLPRLDVHRNLGWNAEMTAYNFRWLCFYFCVRVTN